MQHQQQAGGGGPQSLGGYNQGQGQSAPPKVVISSDEHQKFGDLGIAEAASPISSRPPAPAAIANNDFEEVMRATAEAAGGPSGNRWPRQETLALLQIRSEMDAAFRDATLKGPLWEQVSRKLAELGYKRSAKKCKEKFENVHKYYKRTKEGRAGRQDGKSYKFFNQLEALQHNMTATAIPTTHSPLQILPRIPTNPTSDPLSLPPGVMPQPPPPAAGAGTTVTRDAPAVTLFNAFGVSFSSNSSSSSEGDDDQDVEEEEDVEMGSADNPHNRKRKRSHRAAGTDSDERMMDFFEGLMKQVMQKQEAMQQRFLEAIEKREQDRMIREEAWKRQDMARLAREHELMAQERAISASRDAAIIAFLQKITGQTIHLPTAVPRNPPPPSVPVSQPPPSEPQQQHQLQPAFPEQQQSLSQTHQQRRDQLGVSSSHPQQTQTIEIVEAHDQLQNTSETVAAAIPEQHMPLQDFTGSISLEVTSSRWPKAEVIALIKLRSSLESRYQDAGPKGPLWEEISAGMQRMGYNRNAKRCKEKWENINKYFKKVKESNKKRSEDSKTCPYFNELDALYRKKVLGNTSGNVIGGGGGGGASSGFLVSLPEQEQQQDVGMLSLESLHAKVSENKDGGKTQLQTSSVGAYSSGLFGKQSQDNIGGAKQPEDILKKQHQQRHGDMIDDGYYNVVCSNSDDLAQENDDDNYEEVDENEDYDDKPEEEIKMAYKIGFQRQNVGSSTGGGTASTTFMAMVQ
ncbi:Trihelix transcription factor GTL1 [Sesamum alatum]|uniref:Trihelix transcription factor GTL1 n=1 Tax=Sesamum alatum TaxID=300844 RepID=A0AAE2CUD5_9LAMI|nr:Trihelix transcription factor GTL1 [Sesamum alatum]